MSELSVFVDESGDFGPYDVKSPFYIIGIVMHNQGNDISNQISCLNNSLKETKLKRDFVHIGPLIRREQEYRYMTAEERSRILRRMLKFAQKTDFAFATFYVDKKNVSDDYEMIAKLAKQLSEFVKQHYAYFLSFDTVKLYYDGGQGGVLKIILAVFTTLLENVKYRKSLQKDYKLLQVADLVCTAQLIELKMERKLLSKSERNILGSKKEIWRQFLRPLYRKKIV